MIDNICQNCPRHCSKGKTYCDKEFGKVRIAKIMRHRFEEPPICPEDKGSGAVFFSHCSLKCVFCQNYDISHLGEGKDFTLDELVDIFKRVEKSGVANLNLVTPTHYFDIIVEALKRAKLSIPVVWNSSGYEECENIKKLKGLVDIFLFDLKYYDNNLALRYSKAPNYFDKAIASIKIARDMIPEDIYDNGEMKKGIIIRHLVLPSCSEDSIKIFDNLKNIIGNKTCISVMSQYIPFYKAKDYPEINRFIKPLEYKKVISHIKQLGFNNGFIQDYCSASKEYTPDFTLEKFWEL